MVADRAQLIEDGLRATGFGRMTQSLREPPAMVGQRRPRTPPVDDPGQEPPVEDPRPEPPPDKPPPGKKRVPRDDPDENDQPVKEPPGTQVPPVKEPPRQR